MKKIFTLALVLILALSMSAQKSVTSMMRDSQIVGSSGNIASNKVLNKEKIDSDIEFVKLGLHTGVRNVKLSYIDETFDADIPATWTVNNTGTGSLPGWFWENTDAHFSFVGFACIDSDANGSGETTKGELITPAFDCSAAAGVRLEFDTRFNYISSSDTCKVAVWDGSVWQTVVDWHEDHGSSSTPEHVIVDISAYKNADCKVEFFYTDGGGYNWYFGVDNVKIYQPIQNDLSAEVIAPLEVNTGSDVDLQVVVGNLGAAAASNYTVQLVLNDGTSDAYTSSKTILDTLAPGSDTTITLDTWTSVPSGTYTATFTITYASDESNTNNTFVDTVEVFPFIYGADTTVSVCGMYFYDTGGKNNSYSNGEDYVITFLPDSAGKMLQVDFSDFSVEDGWDYLYVYDGTDIYAPLLASLTGASIPDSIVAANLEGALTFHFVSDNSTTKAGWNAYVHCVDPVDHDLAVVNVMPNLVLSGATIQPEVTLQNLGANDETGFNLWYTNKDGSYSGTQTISETMLSLTQDTILLPSWSPADGRDTLIVAVVVANDTLNENDTIEKAVNVVALDYNRDTIYSYNVFDFGSGWKDHVVGVGLDSAYFDIDTALTGGVSIYCADFVGNIDTGMIYGISKNSEVYVINGDGQTYYIGAISVNDVLGLTWDQTTDVVYLATWAGDIYTLNINTLQVAKVGVTNINYTIGIASDTLGNLYLLSLDNNLYKINKSNFTPVLVGDIGLSLNYAQDIGFDRNTNTLYGTLYDAGGGTKGGLYTMDLTTGEARSVINYEDELAACAVYSSDESYTVTFNVEDTLGNSLENAKIRVNGQELTTDVDGEATLVLSNTYTAITSLPTYITDTTDFSVAKDTTLDIVLVPMPRYTVTFEVKDTLGVALANANVNVNGIDLTTDANGEATLDTINGNYTSITSLDRFVSDTTNFAVADSAMTIHIELTPANLVTFVVKDIFGDILEGANIDVNGQLLVTDTSGIAKVSLLDGSYSSITSLTGYEDDSTDFTLASKDTILNIELVPIYYPVTFTVTNGTDSLANAQIVIDTNTLTTDAHGQAVLSFSAGTYSAITSLATYNNDTTSFTVVDTALAVNISLTLVVAIDELSANVAISPNPSNGLITITADDNYSVQVLDINGRVITTTQMDNNRTEIDITSAPAGMYIVRLTNNEGSFSYKVIKK